MTLYIGRRSNIEGLFYSELEELKAQIYRFLMSYNFRLWGATTKEILAEIKKLLLILTIELNKSFLLHTAC